MNVNHQADKTNRADKPDSESTDGKEITCTEEREVRLGRENYRKRKRDPPEELEQE